MPMQRPLVGDLRRRVTIMKWVDTPANDGSLMPQYTEMATVWADVQPVAGSVFYGSKQVSADVTHQIVIRRRADITANHLLMYRGIRYRVRRVTDMNDDRRFTVIEAEELGNDT